MQALKDTFYLMLRDRIASGNAGRMVVVRGTLRPGVLVVENELPGASVEGLAVPEAFCLRWTGLRVQSAAALPLTVATCEIRYATDGTTGNAAMDRGRALAAMDAELSAALLALPQSLAKVQVAGGETPDGSNVFWGEPAFSPAVMRAERMERSATVEVFCHGS